MSQIGNGIFSFATTPEEISLGIPKMINTSSFPLLTDIKTNLGPHCRLYPPQLPDLFLDSYITISGDYTNNFPSNFILTGKLIDGSEVEIEISVGFIPSEFSISRIFAPHKIENLCCKYWLENDEKV